MNWPAIIIALVALQRLAELFYARRNTARLLSEGGIEIGAKHYPLIMLLHLSWLIAVYLAANKHAPPLWGWIVAFCVLQGLRLWVLASLGRYWTTRIITLPQAPLVRRGPYRFLRHPNYAVVIGEIAVLPLAFREPWIALIFSLLNAAMLWWRIRIEGAALDRRKCVIASEAKQSRDQC